MRFAFLFASLALIARAAEPVTAESPFALKPLTPAQINAASLLESAP